MIMRGGAPYKAVRFMSGVKWIDRVSDGCHIRSMGLMENSGDVAVIITKGAISGY